jgi:branched-subunit amino acid aminotransferase/4-amino-4-deoxychorismate lyase
MPFALWADKVRDGLHLLTPTIRHLPPECQNPHVKCRSRMHFFLAEKEAKAIDPLASALLLDLAGNVTETNAANFFMVEHGTLCSPTLQNTLPGISRATAIELARRLEIPFAERDISPEQVAHADEAFLSSTPYALAPVTRFNGSPVGQGMAGPIYRAILSAWSEEVELDIERQIIEMGSGG